MLLKLNNKHFFVIFEGLSLNLIKKNLEGESSTLNLGIWCVMKFELRILNFHFHENEKSFWREIKKIVPSFSSILFLA